jgi:DNA-directed RNA polymerase subunit RPC12/RpoP
MNIKREFSNLFYVYTKKHYCLECSTKLKTTTQSKVVNPKSPDAKEYDFYFVDSYLIGDVKFVWTEFECPNCGFRIKVRDLKKLEREQKKRGE